MIWRSRTKQWLAALKRRVQRSPKPKEVVEGQEDGSEVITRTRRRKSKAEEREELQAYVKIVESRDEPFDVDTYQHILQLCTRLKSLSAGLKVHAHIAKSRMESERFVGNNLVFMYACFGNAAEARRIFDNLGSHNLFSFTGIIRAYIRAGDPDEALKLFHLARLKTFQPDESMFAMAVEASGMQGNLESGISLHNTIRRNKMDKDPNVAAALIGMYSKCRKLDNAIQVFEEMKPLGRVTVWNACLAAFSHNGDSLQALNMFRKMVLEGLPLNPTTYLLSLQSVRGPDDLKTGMSIHRCILESGNFKFYHLGVELVSMYGLRCDRLEESVRIFKKLRKRDTRSWNAMLKVFVQRNMYAPALDVFESLHRRNISPNRETYLTVLDVQGLDLKMCKRIHAQLMASGIELDGELMDKLVAAYASTEQGRNGSTALLKVHKRIVKWVERRVAAEKYVHSYFNFQD